MSETFKCECGYLTTVKDLYFQHLDSPCLLATGWKAPMQQYAWLSNQVAGDHYKKYKIQPTQYIVANGIGFLAGNVIKYTTRYKDKNGAEDIRKAIHYLNMILEFEYDQK